MLWTDETRLVSRTIRSRRAALPGGFLFVRTPYLVEPVRLTPYTRCRQLCKRHLLPADRVAGWALLCQRIDNRPLYLPQSSTHHARLVSNPVHSFIQSMFGPLQTNVLATPGGIGSDWMTVATVASIAGRLCSA